MSALETSSNTNADGAQGAKRRWGFRFSLQTLALLFVALAVALLLPRHRSFTQQLAAKRLTSKGAKLIFGDRRDPQSIWSRVVFGDDRYDFVEVIKVERMTLSESDIDGLASFRGVETLIFYECPTTDSALRAARHMKSLELLHIERTTISTRGVNQLRGLRRLDNLRIEDTRLEGVDLSFLSTFRRLKTLTLTGRSVDDSVIGQVANYTDLCFVGIEDASITDRGLAALQRCTSLEDLVIRESSGVSGIGLGALAPLSKLGYLDLEGSAINDEGLRQIAHIQSLTRIRLYSTRVTENTIATLKLAMPNCKVMSDYDMK